MANNYVGSPPIWIIDTASSTAITTGWVRIARIVWDAGASGVAGDECLVEDSAGNKIFDEFATGAEYETETDYEFDRNKGKSVHGLKVVTLAHGVVRIYLA